ncbi:MAG: exodeoxyribonuclease VII large subunit [Clostridia bacterium]|nr:exodeoxyribonuclease VII large subunit [Clostridia bacterium]
MEQAVFSVSELNEYVQLTLSHDPNLRNLRVQGEISGFHRHSSGHLYFTLKDDKAAVRCVMFRSAAMKLRFSLKDGVRVQISGQASLYQKDGSFQVYCEGMEELGEGELFLKFLKLKEELAKKGYFDEARKRSIPALPNCVGIATSKTGAALQDMLNILKRRFPTMPYRLYHCAVQGVGAAKEIAKAIDAANAEGVCDVLIVGRGGGSLEDLWAFNELPVAEAIYRSEIPIISAVGHETDFSIADFAADLRAPTPSAAAELAVPEYEALLRRLLELRIRLNNALGSGIERKKARLELLAHSPALQKAGLTLLFEQQRSGELFERLNRRAGELLNKRNSALSELGARLKACNPREVLKRGFALVSGADGALICRAEELSLDQELNIRFADGMANAVVRERTLDERENL